jgi:hypothetical protein
MWFIPAESGWGANFTQNANILFVTFFIYDQNGKPTWYVAILGEDANGNFSGTLYSTVGTYFGSPWNPSAYAATPAGTASFSPLNSYQGTLSYTVNSVPTVNKNVVRQTLTTIDLTGNFTGGQAGGYSNCSNAGNNFSYTDTFDNQGGSAPSGLVVTQSAGNVSMVFAYSVLGANCTFSGALVQNGQLYTVPSATYTCDDGTNTTASMSEIKLTSQGIEGRFTSPSVNGCREDAAFSAVKSQ